MVFSYSLLEWTDEQIQRFWKYQAQFPEAFFSSQVGQLLLKRIKKHLKGKKSAMDYGCGLGFFIPHLLSEGLSVTAVEFSPQLIDTVNLKFRGYPNFKGGVLPEAVLSIETKYDAIFVIEVIEHLNDFYLTQLISHLKTLLSEKGVAVITTPNEENLAASYVFCPGCEKVFHRMQHMRSWSKSTLSDFLSSHDFEPIETFCAMFGYNFRAKATYFVKRLLGYPVVPPHLVCICRKKRKGQQENGRGA